MSLINIARPIRKVCSHRLNYQYDYSIFKKSSFNIKCSWFSKVFFCAQYPNVNMHSCIKLNFLYLSSINKTFQSKLLTNVININNIKCNISREKSKKKRTIKSDGYESSSEDEDESDIILESGKLFRDIKVRVPSLRMDVLLKAGLGISRNKVEELFYGSKLRINKEKIKKKSISLHEGDTVDVIKGSDTSVDTNKLEISRVILKKIISFDEDSGIVLIILRKYPKIILENYNDDVVDE